MCIQSSMSGKSLLTRTLGAMALAIGVYVLVGSVALEATPVRPDAQKLVSQPESPPFVPARVGWDGPGNRAPSHARNPFMESISPERINSDFQEMVLSLAIPDTRLVICLAALIFLMRMLLRINRKRAQSDREVPSREKVAA